MRPLKIALLSRWYWEEMTLHNDQEGGASRQLAEALAALGHEVVVLSQSPDVQRLRQAQIGALETWLSPRDRYRTIFSALRDNWMSRTHSHPNVYSDALTLGEFLKKRGPFDVIWAHAESPDGLVADIAASIGIPLPPVLLQIQALRHRLEKGKPIFTAKKPLGLAFRRATRILAPSESVVEALSNYADASLPLADLRTKVHVLHPNVHSSFVHMARESAAEPEPTYDRVLFLGALDPGKGASIFLKAVVKTEVAKRPSIFVMIGDFTKYNTRIIKRWEKAQEATRLQLPGARMDYIDQATPYEMARQIKLAKVVVVPSLYEAYAMGVPEALMIGRPVITTDRVGSHPLVQQYQAGIIIAPNDSDALARAIDVAVSPVVPLAALARQIGPQLAQEFSPQAVALKISQHLSAIAG